MVLVRFAPSPTGPLHLGGLRMALYNHLFARKNKGKWVLRIEDTDKTRYVPGSVEGIQRALAWAGLNYDYGPGKEGPHGPYFQSQRLDLYQTYSSKLIESGHAYRCFCTPDTLASVKEKLARSGASASYDRRCLHLTEEEVVRKVKAGEKHTVRFNTTALPSRPPTEDLVFRHLRDAHQSLATDPILLKSDLFPTYHLASIVDDHEMGITHVLRGEEWITSLPLHLDLYASLKLTPPKFAHFPILLNPDGSKMSKRHGDIRVDDFIERGWEPDAVLNWLLLCGYGVRNQAQGQDHPGQKVSGHQLESNTIMNLDEMVELFDITNITQRNTILEAANLHYINKHHLMKKMKNETELGALVELVKPKVMERFPESAYATDSTIRRAIVLLEGRLTNIYDLPKLVPYLFEEPPIEDVMRGFTSPEALKRVVTLARDTIWAAEKWDVEELTPALQYIYPNATSDNVYDAQALEDLNKLGIKKKDVLRGLRWGLTGMKEGPALVDTMVLLGRTRVMDRLLAIEQWRDVKDRETPNSSGA